MVNFFNDDFYEPYLELGCRTEAESRAKSDERARQAAAAPPKELDSWKQLISDALKDTGESFSDIVSTLSEEEMNEKFDACGGAGKPFTAWGPRYVYFPVCYDASDWVGYAPRNPCDEPTHHQGNC